MGLSVVEIPYNYYKYYCDKDVLQESYPYIETWEDTCSHKHRMFDAMGIVFSHILGIEFKDGIKIKPFTNKRLKSIRVKIKTDTGYSTVNYHMSDDKPIVETDKKYNEEIILIR